MSLDRRRFLALIGATAILAADIPAARRARASSPPGTPSALAPWFAAGTGETEMRRRALAWAVLAPSPHNRQPWSVALEGDDALTLYCRVDRRLPHTDPYDRQITIGLGAFLETLVLAAGEQGAGAEVSLFPQGEPGQRLDERPVARVRFVPGAGRPDPLFEAVLDRRSNKAPYAMDRAIPAHTLGRLTASALRGGRVASATDAATVAAIREVALSAMRLEMETPATAQESIDLLRIGRAEVDASPDGIDLTGAMIEDLAARGILTRENAGAEVASGAPGPILQQMTAYGLAPIEASPSFLWVTTGGNARSDQIAAGRDWMRLNLAATSLGLGLHPLSQALQEFPEMADHAARMRARLDVPPGETLQMLGRLGYGPEVPPSPRWPAAAAIREG
ncbi:Acg family FMN-binding oxidoreductase [Salinarimonas sp. NSM]|uniref:Acg family FMN-binding oxidoreductase n=1 Tax=Salinarimonas sp. NSM TaxID=3458003 RepID=UPI00403652FE